MLIREIGFHVQPTATAPFQLLAQIRGHCNVGPLWQWKQITTTCSKKEISRSRNLVGGIPASQLGGRGFKSLPGARLSYLRLFVIFLSPSPQARGSNSYLAMTRSFRIRSKFFYQSFGLWILQSQIVRAQENEP